MKNNPTNYYSCPLLLSSKILQEDAKESVFYDFTKLNEEQLLQWLEQACQEGDISLVRYLLTSNELPNKPNVHGSLGFSNYSYYEEEPVYYAVANNRIEIVKYLTTSKELLEHANIRHTNDYLLLVAAQHGQIDMVEYLLSDSSIPNLVLDIGKFTQMGEYPKALPVIKYLLTHEKHKKLLDMHDKNNFILTTVCSSGSLETLQYLLTSEDLEKKPQFSKNGNYIVRLLQYNNIEMVDYLLHSTELKDYFNENNPDINNHLNKIKVLCRDKHKKALEYLLFDYNVNVPNRINDMMAEKVCEYASEDLIDTIINEWNIPYTDSIAEKVKNNKELQKAFEKRQLNRELTIDLHVKSTKTIKYKV